MPNRNNSHRTLLRLWFNFEIAYFSCSMTLQKRPTLLNTIMRLIIPPFFSIGNDLGTI